MEQKIAVITGGATGIGKGCALKLAASGIGVVINYSRSETEAKKTLEEINEQFDVPCMIYQADVSKDQEVRGLIEETISRFKRIDVLINNAGYTRFVDNDDLEGLTDEDWERTMAVNVVGTFNVSRAAADSLRKNNGSIINMVSISGLTGMGSSIAYAASKAAGISVTKSLARVLAPEIRVNGVAPGIVNTRWVAGREDHIKWLSENTPLGRVAEPDDVAEMVMGLIHAKFVTGEIVRVDGGMFI